VSLRPIESPALERELLGLTPDSRAPESACIHRVPRWISSSSWNKIGEGAERSEAVHAVGHSRTSRRRRTASASITRKTAIRAWAAENAHDVAAVIREHGRLRVH
jgi:hypothetical protein